MTWLISKETISHYTALYHTDYQLWQRLWYTKTTIQCRLYNDHVHGMYHYNDVIMSAMASQITDVSIVYLTVCLGADQRKHQSSASLVFVGGIHRSPVNSTHKGTVTQKMFPFDDVIMHNKHSKALLWYYPICVKMWSVAPSEHLGTQWSKGFKFIQMFRLVSFWMSRYFTSFISFRHFFGKH